MSFSLTTDPQAFGLKSTLSGVTLPTLAPDPQAFCLKSTVTSIYSYTHSWAERSIIDRSWDMQEISNWYSWRTTRFIDDDDDKNPFLCSWEINVDKVDNEDDSMDIDPAYMDVDDPNAMDIDNDDYNPSAPIYDPMDVDPDYMDVDDPNAMDIDNDDYNPPAPVYDPMDVDEPPKRRAFGFLTQFRRLACGVFSAIIRKGVKHSCAKPSVLKRLLITV